MSDDLPPNARIRGLNLSMVRVLYLVTHWYNNLSVNINRKEHRLATHPEPSMAELFQPTPEKYDEDHEAAHRTLLDRDLLKRDWLWRRKVNWLPTDEGLRAIRSIFPEAGESLRPEWADESETGPIYGDPNELLTDGKGVEAIAHFLKEMSWAKRVSYYPQALSGNEAGDLRVRTPDSSLDWEVEVLCGSNNTDQWNEKWLTFSGRMNTTVWIFDDRSTMCRLLNTIHHAEMVNHELDGGLFSEPYRNWSKKAVNQKLRRSRDLSYFADDAGGLAHTITDVLDADTEELADWVESYIEQRAGSYLEPGATRK